MFNLTTAIKNLKELIKIDKTRKTTKSKKKSQENFTTQNELIFLFNMYIINLLVYIILFITNIIFISNNCDNNKFWHHVTNIIAPDAYFLLKMMGVVCS